MNAKRVVGVALLVCMAMWAGACSDEGGGVRADGGHAAGDPGTGIPEADAVIRAARAGDGAALVGLARYTDVRCLGEPPGYSTPEPLCSAAGAPTGAAVETLPLLVCQGEYVPRGEVPGTFEAWLRGYAFTFAGLLKPERHPFDFPSSERVWRAPDYAVVFRATGTSRDGGADARDFIFFLGDGAIVAVQGSCGGAIDLPPADDPAWLVPPPR